MTTTLMILKLHLRDNLLKSKLQNQMQLKSTIFNKVSFQSKKFNQYLVKIKIIFGKLLKKNCHGAILPSTKQNEKSTGLVSM